MFAANRASRTLPVTLEVKDSPRTGMIGVGTWNTQAEFKDIRVTKDGKTLFTSDFSHGVDGWEMSGGQWGARDGSLCQMGEGDGVRALAGNADWGDYTLTLKAKKTGGAEGFLILFNVQNLQEKCWWNIGGWGNTRHGLEGAGLPAASVRGTIETGRWYTIKLELKGPSVQCYLDNKLVHSVTYKPQAMQAATAGLSAGGDELILKVVNGSRNPLETGVTLRGLQQVEPQGQAIVLASKTADAENNFDSPLNVTPQQAVIEHLAPEFMHTFPAYSVTILRIKPGK
jgi:alpha-L-arabinofuranosidase